MRAHESVAWIAESLVLLLRTLLVAGAFPARKCRRKLVRFVLETMGAPAAVIGDASHAALVGTVTLAVCGGIPCAIVWAAYSLWRAR